MTTKRDRHDQEEEDDDDDASDDDDERSGCEPKYDKCSLPGPWMPLRDWREKERGRDVEEESKEEGGRGGRAGKRRERRRREMESDEGEMETEKGWRG